MADATPESPRYADDEDEVVMEVRMPAKLESQVNRDEHIRRVLSAIELATSRRLDHSLPDRAAHIRQLVAEAIDTQCVEPLLLYLERSGWLDTSPFNDSPLARAYAMARLRVDVEMTALGRTSVWPRDVRGGRRRRVLVVRKRKRKQGPTRM